MRLLDGWNDRDDSLVPLIAPASEWRTIATALRSAGDFYEGMARKVDDVHPTMADRLIQQAAEARALADAICEEAGV